jgi:hypothetical protein
VTPHDLARFATDFPWLLTDTTQRPPEVIPARPSTLDRMKNLFRGRHARAARWAAGVTLAGFLAGGGLALAAGDGSASEVGQSGPSTSNAQLNALLSASGSTTATSTAATGHGRIRSLRRLGGRGGMYGSFTFRTKSGDETLAFERGTIQSVSSSAIVVRAADGTTMTWQLVSDTVVRDRGLRDQDGASTGKLSAGQLIFVGGPVVSGARDARLVVVRTGGSAGPAGRTTSVS